MDNKITTNSGDPVIIRGKFNITDFKRDVATLRKILTSDPNRYTIKGSNLRERSND